MDVLDINDPGNIMKIGPINASAEDDSANSAAVFDGTVAVAIEADSAQQNVKVVFYSGTDFSKLGEAPTGALSDILTFIPGGPRVLVANEGEPSDDYSNNPEGSISVIDVGRGFQMPPVTTLDFRGFNDWADALRASGVRVFSPNAGLRIRARHGQ